MKPTTLPETNISPKNGWLEYFLVSFWGVWPIFSCELLVSGSVPLLVLEIGQLVNPNFGKVKGSKSSMGCAV